MNPRQLSAGLLRRFSWLGLASVGSLLVTGTYMAFLRLGSVEALTGSLYGRSLLLKLGLALPMLALGAVNLLRVSPGMQRGPAESAPAGLAWARRSVTTELAFGAAVLLVVGLVTALPPPRASTAPALRASATADDLDLTLTISPGRVGLNTFSLVVTANGEPVSQAREVALRFTPAGGSVAPSEAGLAETEPGVYQVQGANLSLPDTWQVQAVVRRTDRFDAFANFDFDLAAGAARSSVAWHRVTGGLLLAAALLSIFALGRLPVLRPRPALAAYLPAIALFAAGAAVFYLPPPGVRSLPVNPIPPNADSIALGQALYVDNCLACHGRSGKGDGPVGLTLNPRPADLSAHAVPGVHPDGQLYEWITNGFPGSAVMPAFRSVLTDEQRWHLVNYIRTLAP
jgi:copper transport protein